MTKFDTLKKCDFTCFDTYSFKDRFDLLYQDNHDYKRWFVSLSLEKRKEEQELMTKIEDKYYEWLERLDLKDLK